MPYLSASGMKFSYAPLFKVWDNGLASASTCPIYRNCPEVSQFIWSWILPLHIQLLETAQTIVFPNICCAFHQRRLTLTSIIIKLSPRSTKLSCRCFATVTLRLTHMTLKLEGDLDILKVYLFTENEAAS